MKPAKATEGEDAFVHLPIRPTSPADTSTPFLKVGIPRFRFFGRTASTSNKNKGADHCHGGSSSSSRSNHLAAHRRPSQATVEATENDDADWEMVKPPPPELTEGSAQSSKGKEEEDIRESWGFVALASQVNVEESPKAKTKNTAKGSRKLKKEADETIDEDSIKMRMSQRQVHHYPDTAAL